jgi:hypothetical protein
MKRPQYVFRPNLNDPQHRRAWALLQQVPPAKRKEFLVQSIRNKILQSFTVNPGRRIASGYFESCAESGRKLYR